MRACPNSSPLKANADIQTGLTLDTLGPSRRCHQAPARRSSPTQPERSRRADDARQYPARAEALRRMPSTTYTKALDVVRAERQGGLAAALFPRHRLSSG